MSTGTVAGMDPAPSTETPKSLLEIIRGGIKTGNMFTMLASKPQRRIKVDRGILVTAADFNGQNFDGSPLIPVNVEPETLRALLSQHKIMIVPDSTSRADYAQWDVVTPDGVVRAEPGNFIVINEVGDLFVVEDKELVVLEDYTPSVEVPNGEN